MYFVQYFEACEREARPHGTNDLRRKEADTKLLCPPVRAQQRALTVMGALAGRSGEGELCAGEGKE